MAAEVLFERVEGQQGDIGVITLNRPKAINALTKNMCIAIYNQLVAWEISTSIKAIVIRGAGERGFCAGGDIRQLYEQRDKTVAELHEFFWHEYRLNHKIFHYPKPYLALLHGITMGGGVGVSIHGSFRVATDTLRFAMPETSIGLFPDVGGSYFLPRFTGKIGWYLALTGAAINVADAYYIGAVSHQIKADSLDTLIQALAQAPFHKDAHNAVANVLQQFAVSPATPMLSQYRTAIDMCFKQESVEAILQALADYPDPWCRRVVKIMRAKSPTSLKVAFEQLKRGAKLNFDDAMRMEYRLTAAFLQNHDFYEGVRAVLIDKDQKPDWQPKELAQVTTDKVASYFDVESNELEFK